MGNPFVHVELNTQDVDKAKAFYGKLFDWKMEDMPMGGGDTYTVIGVGDGTGGGMMKAPMPNMPSAWLAYVGVDSAEDSTKKARSLGGTILKDVTDIPNVGRFSVIADPTGAVFAVFEPKR